MNTPKLILTREEKDSMGTLLVPTHALYGASTQRAVLNFPVSGMTMPVGFIQAMALIKWGCAKANAHLGTLSADKALLIEQVCQEILQGQLLEHFPVDVFQTGSATSSNMNINEVIANRASELRGHRLGSKMPLHPNDDVNKGQSSNDTMPTALHVSVALALRRQLKPALEGLEHALRQKEKAWAHVIKIGRTHLMDATPLTLGQVFSGYARQVQKGRLRVEKAEKCLSELAIGGTAVGTGINCTAGLPECVIAHLNEQTQMDFCKAQNHFEAQAARDDCAEVAGYLNAIAASLAKIANDIRLLGSGPRCGLGELILPATQPGSSIMPGKVNPVMPEMLIQATLYATGLNQTTLLCARDGQFELNVTIPLMAHCLLSTIQILSQATQTFTKACIEGLTANTQGIAAMLERSLMLVTALNPHIGYDRAAEVAKKAFQEGKTLRQVVLEQQWLDAETLDQALDPKGMI